MIEDFLDPIGLTTKDFAEKMTGGWLFGYVAALAEAGWRSIIVWPSASVTSPQRLIHLQTGAPIWLLPRSQKMQRRASLRALAAWFDEPRGAINDVLDIENCHAMLAQEYEYTRFDVLVRLARGRRIPLFATFQGGDRTLSAVEAAVRSSSLRLCSGLIVAATVERERLANCYPDLKLQVAAIPNPLDTLMWQPLERSAARRQLGISEDCFVAIYHGRIEVTRKGLDVLLAAWTQVAAGELVIIGSGQDHALFSTLVAEHASGRIRWLASYTTDRQLIRCWLSAADVYVSASRVEGMPVAPLEAMACGLPIVVTDAQGLADILLNGESSGGILVQKDDPAALAAALDRLRTSPELRHQLGALARQRVVEEFSIASVARRLVDLLPQLPLKTREER